MTRQQALLIAESAALPFAREIADRLQSEGLDVALSGFDTAQDAHATADLVILGASVTSFRSHDGDALRRWLMTIRAAREGQYAAAFDLHHGRVRWQRESTAFCALRAMSARGFRLASRPVSFRVTQDHSALAPGETSRAHEWALGLAARSAHRGGHAYALAGSGQGH